MTDHDKLMSAALTPDVKARRLGLRRKSWSAARCWPIRQDPRALWLRLPEGA
jgi:hypothetical protein